MKKSVVIAVSLLVMALALVGGWSAFAQDEAPAATVMLSENDELGSFFVDANGMTLYIFTNDELGVSNCVDQCATNWPPLTVAEGETPVLAEGISGRLATIKRADGTFQVVYNGMPLYYWVNDKAAGETTGHEVGGVWFVAQPPMVGLGGNADLGKFLVGMNGMTLYTFANDEAGVSNCVDQCATNWPPLTVDSEEALTSQAGLLGEFGVIERADGTLQVTLNEFPLYYWKDDMAPGDATGHNVGDVWFVAKLPTLAAQDNEEFGQILVGSNGLTLYTFANDAEGVSNCADQCAVNWPPLTVAADEEPVAEGLAGTLGVIERADGRFQVTYNGLPLYYWRADVVNGDTTGHNFNDVWAVALP